MKRVVAAMLAALIFSACLPIRIIAQGTSSADTAPETENAGAAQVHTAYVAGMPDGSFHPTAALTRAELAQMVYRVREYWPAAAEESTEELTEELPEQRRDPLRSSLSSQPFPRQKPGQGLY